MQIVINIPKEMYQKIKETNMVISGRRSGERFDYILFNAVNTGTPLPKGHGRLIDAGEVEDAIYKCFEGIQCYDGTGYDIYSDTKENIDKIPTIIEADKAEREDKK